MIIARLAGGLGNQMFQYAFARTLSLRHNTPLKIDLSFLKNRNMGHNFVYRNYELDIFNVVEDFDFTFENCIRAGEPSLSYSQELVNSIDIHQIDKDIMIDGYWQSVKYFSDFQSVIKSDFTFKSLVDDSDDDKIKSMLSDIRMSNSVMLNIRRTDFLNTDFHGVMGLEYINKSTELLESKIDNPKYFIFSDDIQWCKENINLNNMVIVDHSYKGDRFSYYLQLMKECKNFIIPNSSFAWWSAWLSDSPNKIVISPKRWLTDESINTSDLIPSDWIRI
jgi:hypothetical protein